MGEYKYVRKTMRYNGKKYEATGKTEREAQRKLTEKIAAAKAGEETEPGGNMTVNAWFEEWMKTYKEPKGIGDARMANLRSAYRVRISPEIGTMKLCNVKDVHLQRILNRMAGMSTHYIGMVMGIMKGMFSRARKSRMISWDPSEDIEPPKGTDGHHRSLTDAEREAILDVAETHKRGLWIRTLLWTGMRPGETAALTWSNVDFVNNEIHVTAARASGSRDVKGPKTESGIRDIPIHASLRPLLLAARGEPFSLVFPSRSGGVACHGSMRRWWASFAAAVEEAHPGVLGKDVSAYCLRHTFCTDLQNAGVPINVAKDLMGHSDIGVTANIYTHRTSRTLHDGIALLDGTAVEKPVEKGESGSAGP